MSQKWVQGPLELLYLALLDASSSTTITPNYNEVYKMPNYSLFSVIWSKLVARLGWINLQFLVCTITIIFKILLKWNEGLNGGCYLKFFN